MGFFISDLGVFNMARPPAKPQLVIAKALSSLSGAQLFLNKGVKSDSAAASLF
jgi:hypothetical protein